MRSSVADALQKLKTDPGILFSKVLEHGSMSVEIYKPVAIDQQTAHTQDELYVIISGSGDFYNNGERNAFVAGDVLFVVAGVEHRFENFTDDFATWVIFYGPLGGEGSK
jgi:mannose-6-phosphate isomerase-like protein (cupin superfamily)